MAQSRPPAPQRMFDVGQAVWPALGFQGSRDRDGAEARIFGITSEEEIYLLCSEVLVETRPRQRQDDGVCSEPEERVRSSPDSAD
jgi:hypothetical protein